MTWDKDKPNVSPTANKVTAMTWGYTGNQTLRSKVMFPVLTSTGSCLPTNKHVPAKGWLDPELQPLLWALTLLSPPDTARMFPVMDQLTCHTTSLNLCSSLAVHVFPEGSSHVQINTRPSCGQSSGKPSVRPTWIREDFSYVLFYWQRHRGLKKRGGKMEEKDRDGWGEARWGVVRKKAYRRGVETALSYTNTSDCPGWEYI